MKHSFCNNRIEEKFCHKLWSKHIAPSMKIVQLLYLQDAQLSQRDRSAGCVIVLAKSGRLELGDNILLTL